MKVNVSALQSGILVRNAHKTLLLTLLGTYFMGTAFVLARSLLTTENALSWYA